MNSGSRHWLAAALLALFAGAGCSGATTRATTSPVPAGAGMRPPVSTADVHFMSGMIPHHAQAILIAGWAATHEAGAEVKRLSERIVVAQRDEIEIMQFWLRGRGQTVPAANATHMRMTMNGAEHDMLMPGMLSAEELAQLDRARGIEFDRLFLTAMIRHHEGAISMVEQLFGSYGAAQDEIVFRFASDVIADQSTEIERMQQMLDALTPEARQP